MGDPASDCERDTVEGWSTEIGGGIEGVGIGLGTVGSSGGGPIGCLQKATALKASSASSELLSSIAPEATVHAAWPSASAATSAIVSAPKPRSTPPFCALLLRSPLPADNSSDPSDPRKSFKIVQASRAVALARRTARCALPSSCSIVSSPLVGTPWLSVPAVSWALVGLGLAAHRRCTWHVCPLLASFEQLGRWPSDSAVLSASG